MTSLVTQLEQALSNPSEILFTVLRVIVVYVLLVLALRFIGRRQLGQLTHFDAVIHKIGNKAFQQQNNLLDILFLLHDGTPYSICRNEVGRLGVEPS
jgi:Na+-transporting methylmalonyl-CoA/oxaloacetate decarboxylase beta subunit